MRSAAMIEGLDAALANIESASALVGQEIPRAAEDWAEKNGLDVRRSKFAPPGMLYIIGATLALDLASTNSQSRGGS